MVCGSVLNTLAAPRNGERSDAVVTGSKECVFDLYLDKNDCEALYGGRSEPFFIGLCRSVGGGLGKVCMGQDFQF